jgi:hypothetical protein
MGGGHTAATSESVVNGSTSAATSAPAQTGATDTTLASDFNHISAADAARFDEASGRLQGELDAIVACMREDDSGCVYGERDGFRAALRDSAHNLTGPETRDNPCYQRLEDYDTVLSEIRTVSRWLFLATEPGQPGFPTSLSDFWGRAVQVQEKHRDLAARFLAACTSGAAADVLRAVVDRLLGRSRRNRSDPVARVFQLHLGVLPARD